MPETRSERFVELDARLEDAVRSVRDGDAATTTIAISGTEPANLPLSSLRTLHKLVHALAAGSDALLTTTEAADFIGVSRPYLTRLLKSGVIPYTKRGNRHLVALDAVRDFKDERDRKLSVLDDMAAAEEELGIR